ncbi:metalloregulator ArsR/SmtB family transcription factor [Pseudomonas sp. NR3]|uniref:metalloregulator ArsR/SmtB family transcription factor n=1 Tax=unclassified Pseudomonas TaxID=196821 RepID=UPI003B68296E
MQEPLTPLALFKCLADETRARMTLLIAREGELCVCELTCALDVSQPKISRHLAQLREAGVLMDRRQGQWVYYRLHPSLPEWVGVMLKGIVDANKEWLSTDALRLAEMGERPQSLTACA